MENNFQHNSYQGGTESAGNPQNNAGAGASYGGNPYQKQGYAPYGNSPPAGNQQSSGQNTAYQQTGNPYQQAQSNNTYGQGYRAPGEPQQKPAQPKEPLVLLDLFKRLFSNQPYDVFKVKIDKISLLLILLMLVFFSALSKAGIRYPIYQYSWYLSGFVSFLLVGIVSFVLYAAVLAAMFGYGVLIQGNTGDKKAKMKLVIDAIAASALVPIALYLFSSLFAFFWRGAYSFLSYTALFSHLMLFIDGLEVKLGKKSGQLWYKVALIAVVVLLTILL